MPKATKTKFKSYRHTTNYYRILKKMQNDNSDWDSGENSQKYIKASEGKSSTSSIAGEGGSIECEVNRQEVFYNQNDVEHEFPAFEETDNEVENQLSSQLSLLEDLRTWAISNNITMNSLSDLLKILRNHGKNELPADARTLLMTPPSVEIVGMGNGKFWYHGIEPHLRNLFSQIKVDKIPATISLEFNVDGFSPFNSSNLQFWPILFQVHELRELGPMVVAIYYGDSKPPLQAYFRKFIEEMKVILHSGIGTNGVIINIKIRCFICDTPARSFIKGTPGSNAENGSCIKCTVIGEWDSKGRHMSYPRIHCPLRTDQTFREKRDEDHHREDTPLTQLPINMIEDFIVADSLHLFDLGITRRCLYGWREGSYNFRTKLSKAQADSLSNLLEQCNQFKPVDIPRTIRTLKALKFWKGTEYRTFLLYLGPVVLKDVLPCEVYEHFLMLSCAVSILSANTYLKYIDIAKQLLDDYIEKFIEIYGIDSISSNIHNLCHVIKDVEKFGPLPLISSYPFENYLGQLKPLVRHGKLPLSQLSKRVIEMSKLDTSWKLNNNEKARVKSKLPDEEHILPSCRNVFEELYLAADFILRANEKNCWFMTKDNEIVSMINATYFDNCIYIYGKSVKTKSDFFQKPFFSSNLHIYATKCIREKQLDTHNPKLYCIKNIKCKLFPLQYRNEFIFFPLLHTLDRRINI